MTDSEAQRAAQQTRFLVAQARRDVEEVLALVERTRLLVERSRR
jgi:hypothetical protein